MKRELVVSRFRERLRAVIRASGLSQTAFAKVVGVDRSTLSQVLAAETDRLPRVETLVSVARSQNVSIDWLVGLSEEGRLAASVLQLEPGAGSPSDERLARWRAEAAGYKIRYVPASLPDLLRTDAVIEFEYKAFEHATPEQRRESREERLNYERREETDTEVCTSIQSMETLAQGTGRWAGLSRPSRRKQLRHMADLTAELYPTFRWFFFDELQHYSVPLTVFGPKRAVIYAGQIYLVFNGLEHIRALSRHFDELIRGAVVQPPDVSKWFQSRYEAI